MITTSIPKVNIFKNSSQSLLNFKICKNLPERFVYKNGNQYNIASRRIGDKAGEFLGSMKAEKQFVIGNCYYPNLRSYFSFFIRKIEIMNGVRRNGVGSDLVKLAKKESLAQKDCAGRVHLYALDYRNNTVLKPPQVFYRKNNFTTTDKKALKDIDKCIKNPKNPIPTYFYDGTPMYLDI